MTKWAEVKKKERAKLKLPVPNRPLQDKADLTGTLAELETKYEKESMKLAETKKKLTDRRSEKAKKQTSPRPKSST